MSTSAPVNPARRALFSPRAWTQTGLFRPKRHRTVLKDEARDANRTTAFHRIKRRIAVTQT